MDLEIFELSFMQNAFAAGLLAGISCALVGVCIVIMRLSAIGICIAHAAFAGALFALVIGSNQLLWALVFSLGTGALIGPVADRGNLNPDTSTGIAFSAMLGLSFLFIGFIPGPKTEALSLFWGSILTLTQGDLCALLLATLTVSGALVLFYKEVQAVLCHQHIASALGIPARAVFYGILILIAVTITTSLQSVGGLLVYSLIINPAAAAYQLTYRLKNLFFLSALLGVLSCWTGLFFSALLNLPSGAAIVLCSTAIFITALFCSPKSKAQTAN